MTEEIREKLDSITKKIVEEFKPEKIILFGSYAWGEPHQDSDLDFFVIENSKLPRRLRQINIRRLFLDLNVPADVLSYTPDEVEKRKHIDDLFVIDILEKGKVLYERK